MRRRGKGSTGRRPSTYKQASARQSRSAWQRAVQATRPRPPRRGIARHESNAIPSRRRRGRVSRIPERSRNSQTPRRTDNELRTRTRFRRTRVRASGKTAARGLPAGSLSLRRDNENASEKQTTPRVCTRTKATRRAVIIAKGYGGRNGFKDYKQHKRC